MEAAANTEPYSLRGKDFLILALFSLLFSGSSLVFVHILSTHETAHCENVREMFATGEWLIPQYGGRPWLERPPVPHWLTAAGVAVYGHSDPERSYRIGSILFSTLALLVFGWAVASCLGRTLGLMSAVILGTMREFAAYASGPEADIFLACTVTMAGALLLRLLFAPEAREKHLSFWGKRSGSTIIFFCLLGAMNAMKGPLFGMIFIGLAISGWALWNRKYQELKPLVWIWGWLATLVIGAAWPVYAYLQFPDILDLWAIDYGVRWQKGYLGEPFWYYFAQQPWNLFPWAISTFIGLIVTFSRVRQGDSMLRLTWCWAILPVLFFSLFKGKHHHYMLSCMAPAAVLAAIGAQAFWRSLHAKPSWLNWPLLALPLIGLPGAIAVILLRNKLPETTWAPWFFAVAWPMYAFAVWWMALRKNGQTAFVGICLLFCLANVAVRAYRSEYMNHYECDKEFVRDVLVAAPADRPVYVLNELHPLWSSWMLFYAGDRVKLLHNITYLRDEKIHDRQVHLIARPSDLPALAEYGTTQEVVHSRAMRALNHASNPYTLYVLELHPNLPKTSAEVRMTPLQATGRTPGPYLIH